MNDIILLDQMLGHSHGRQVRDSYNQVAAFNEGWMVDRQIDRQIMDGYLSGWMDGQILDQTTPTKYMYILPGLLFDFF